MVPPHVEKNSQESTLPSAPRDPAKSDPDQTQQVKNAALNVANYIENLYGNDGPRAGWTEDALKKLANGESIHSNALGKDITVPKDIQDSVKTLLAAGGASEFDLHNDGFIQAHELREYANFEPGSTEKI
jgi:hypothetical protein